MLKIKLEIGKGKIRRGNMFNTPDSMIVFFFVIFVVIVTLVYNQIAIEKYKKERERKRSDVLYRSSNTDNGVPANKVFQTLKDAGIEPNYLGAKGENLR